jgi:hypothetical protein
MAGDSFTGGTAMGPDLIEEMLCLIDDQKISSFSLSFMRPTEEEEYKAWSFTIEFDGETCPTCGVCEVGIVQGEGDTPERK